MKLDTIREKLRDNNKFCEDLLDYHAWLDDECMEKIDEFINDLDEDELKGHYRYYITKKGGEDE